MITDLKWLGSLFLINVFVVFNFSQVSLQNRNTSQSDILFTHVVVDNENLNNIWLKTVGDLNGDGQTDLIAGGNTSGGLVWFQSPDWMKHSIADEGRFGTDAEVADIDLDGDQDVIALTGSDLRWYENPGWEVHLIENRELHDVEVSDFDGDGDFDLVARNQGEFGDAGDELHFYRQDSPASWTHHSVNCANGEGLKVADVDRDNDQDVIINGSWFENTNDIVNGMWTEYSYTTSWTHPNTFIDAGDINNDGKLDIVLSPAELAGGKYRLSWFEAPVGPKSDTWMEHIIENDVETVHHFVGVADMDNDGDLDIASAEMEQGSDPDEVKVYLNQDGVGGVWVKQLLATTGSHSMRILDVGNDGDQDLYGANWEGNQLDLWLNQTCQSAFNSWERHVIDSDRPWRAIFITAGDIDLDGLQDIVSGGWWYRNPGNPNGVWARQTVGSPLNNMAAVYDFDGDGLLDILGSMGQGSESDPRFVWARNNGSGAFSIISNIDEGSGDFLQGVAVGILENGGALRVGLSWHAADQGIQILSVPSNPTTDPWTMEGISTISQDEALSIGDVDQDGDQDLLLGTIWLENNGSSWGEHLLHDTGDSPYGESDPDRNRLADINQDGRLDAVIGYEAISVPGKLAWYEQGEETTTAWQEHLIATVVGPMSLDVADIDQDGSLDVIVGEHNLDDPASAKLIIFENVDRIGTQWQEHLVYQGDEHHDGAQVVDIDADGDLDIISIGWNHSEVLLYENTSNNCGNPLPSTVTPTSVPQTSTSTPLSPTPKETLSVTPTPATPSQPIPCLSGLLLPLGILFGIGQARNLFRTKRISCD